MQRIYSRSGPFLYMIFFVMASYLFCYVVEALLKGFSAFNRDLFEQFFFSHTNFAFFALFTVFSILFFKKLSLYFVSFFYCVIVFFLFKNLFFHYHKIIFVVDILYMIIGVLFLNFWKLELRDVIYNPKFTLRDLDLIPPMTLPVRVNFIGDSIQYEGLLSNWSERQCYILFTKNYPPKLKKQVLIEVSFEGKEFKNSGKVRTYFKNNMAIGVEMLSCLESYSWKSLYNVLDQRAMLPEYL